MDIRQPSVEQALVDGPAGELDPVVQLQLAQRGLDVVLHGAVRDDEPLGDLAGGQPGRHHAQDLDLTLGERGRRLVAPDAAILAQHEGGTGTRSAR
jgi:hypothetical protein